MHFCPLCGTLLVVDQPQHVQLSCPACPYASRLHSSISTTQSRAVKRADAVASEDDELEHGSRCAINCPRCPGREALYREFQTRSADEPMTIFYRCTACRFNWKE